MEFSIIILAAGQGKRMLSQLPKVLHHLAGTPLLEHVVQTAEKLHPSQPPIVVYGHQGQRVRHQLADLNVTWVEQTEQLGTGHALRLALPYIPAEHRVLVLYGDVPLISSTTLQRFIQATKEQALGIITEQLENPTGLGRIIRNNHHQIVQIIEEKDLTEQQKTIREINSGIYLFPNHFISHALSQLQNNNTQKEYYLTDVIQTAVQNQIEIHSIQPSSPTEILGVNDRTQLAHLERVYQRHYAEKLMREGVTIMDPNRFDVRGKLTIGQDVFIDINVIFEGHVTIGNHCVIGPNTLLRNVTLGERSEIKANSIVDGAEIGADCLIGPFARIRPNTTLSAYTHVGNFVEIKNSFIGENSKMNHLSYIGDSSVGKRVNVGAGTITCNYDGVNKHRTIIGDEAFIGSNTELVAPLTIGEGATIGAGSTITRDAPPHQLTVGRAQQRSIKHWQRPLKKET